MGLVKSLLKSGYRDLGYAEMASEPIGKAIKGGFNLARKGIVKHNYRPGASLLDKAMESPFGYDLSKKVAIPLTLGILAVGAGSTGMQVRNRSSLGEISASGTINQVTDNGSPTFSDPKKMESMGQTNIAKSFINGQMSTYGAEGDLVFALHNLRKG